MAIVVIAIVTISPTSFKKDEGSREVASISSPLDVIYSRASYNRTAAYNPKLLSARIAVLSENQRARQQNAFRLLSDPSDSFLDLEPHVMGNTLMQEMELAMLGVQQAQQNFDMQLSTIMAGNGLGFQAALEEESPFSTRGDKRPMNASWIGTNAGTQAWGSEDRAFQRRGASRVNRNLVAPPTGINRIEIGVSNAR